MQCVIVTAWQRPAFLQACLDRIEIAARPRGRDLRVVVALDRGATPEVRQVASRWVARHGCGARLVRRTGHGYKGNSFNVLTSYREALAHKPELVHLIEDDVLIGADYFDYHDQAHALVSDAFSVNACRNQNIPIGHDPEPDPTAVYTHPMYQSIGVSFRPAVLQRALVHAIGPYFADPVRYCRAHFPRTRINPAHAEQDGLLNRLSEAWGRPSVYPATPRAYHAGFQGYHRNGTPLEGTIREQADQLLAMSAEEMNERALSYKDHTAIDLDGHREPVSRVMHYLQTTGGTFI